MNDQRFSISGKVEKAKGSSWVPLGETGDRMWSAFSATVNYDADELSVTIAASFDGDRVSVDRLCVERTNGQSVSPSDLTKLVLDQAVHDAAAGAVQPGNGAHLGKRHGRRPTPDELRLVAAVYWFEHATWGKPRVAVMGYWGLSRATANRWIRLAGELYPLPGPHRGEG